MQALIMNDCECGVTILELILIAGIGLWIAILIKLLCRKGEDEDD